MAEFLTQSGQRFAPIRLDGLELPGDTPDTSRLAHEWVFARHV